MCNDESWCLQDEELQYQRFDFVKLRNPEEIQGMISAGYNYAARLEKAGQLEPYLSGKPGKADAPMSPALGQNLERIDSVPRASAMERDIYQL